MYPCRALFFPGQVSCFLFNSALPPIPESYISILTVCRLDLDSCLGFRLWKIAGSIFQYDAKYLYIYPDSGTVFVRSIGDCSSLINVLF